MSTITDPAREIIDICTKLSVNSDKRGQEFLAKAFGVQAWSTEFFQVLFLISQRMDGLIEIVSDLEMDDDIKNEAIQHIRTVQMSFSSNGTQNAWSHSLKNYISSEHVGPIKMLVPQVRLVKSYPKLDRDEIEEIESLISDLREWLNDHQLKDNDFIRQAIIDGLDEFRFRLVRIEWVGWGYSLESLRNLVGAYLALERGTPDLSAAPDAEAVLRKMGGLVAAVFQKLKVGKDVADVGELMLKAYGAATLLIQGQSSVAGFLTSGSPS